MTVTARKPQSVGKSETASPTDLPFFEVGAEVVYQPYMAKPHRCTVTSRVERDRTGRAVLRVTGIVGVVFAHHVKKAAAS